MTRLHLFLVVCPVAGLLAAACSSDSEPVLPPPTTERIEVDFETWASEAAEICERAQEREEALEGASSFDEVPGQFSAFVEIASEQREQLEDLGEPTDRTEEVDELLRRLDEEIALAEELRTIAESGDEQAFQERFGEALSRLVPALNEVASGLGLEACGSRGLE